MNRSLRPGSLTVCVVVAVALAGCGKATDESIPSQVSESTSVSPAPIEPPDANAMEMDRVSRMTDEVTKAAGTDWATVLGGQHWDAQAQELVIYVVNAPGADALQSNIDQAVRAVQGDYTHRFVRVDRSFEELRTLAAEVMSDRHQWAGGFATEVVLVAPDRATNGLKVVATGHVAELRSLLTARVGGVPVAAEQGARPTAP